MKGAATRRPESAVGEHRQGDADFIPALGFHRLTPLFDYVAAVAVRDRAIKRRLLASAGITTGEQVLDVGCGTGTLALRAARAARGVRITGLDADSSILARARRKAAAADLDIRLDEGRSTNLPYPEASFDLVLSTLFFHHVDDDAKRQTASELVRVLRPGGRVVVGDLGRPQNRIMRRATLVTVQLFDGFTTTALNVRGGLPEVLSAAGLRAVKVRDRVNTPTGTYEILTAVHPDTYKHLRRGDA
jgi:cyclopropane fatty-acyl-phospholipid synthase-like methyltransferase